MKPTFVRVAMLICLLGLSTGCSHSSETHLVELGRVSNSEQPLLYRQVLDELKRHNARDVKECNCMKAFHRDFSMEPDDSARYAFDQAVGDHAKVLSRGKQEPVNIFFIGSGLLLNELTAVANIIARRVNAKIFLHDWAYLFYGDHDYRKISKDLALNPKKIAPAWDDFYFWSWVKDGKEDEFFDLFDSHHRAVDQFKEVVKGLDSYYGTHTEVVVVKPVQEFPQKLPPVDIFASIDSFLDFPNFMWLLNYRYTLAQEDFKFIGLNKSKPFGGFWVWEKDELEEANVNQRVQAVWLEIYAASMDGSNGRFKKLLRKDYPASQMQLDHAINFKKSDKVDWPQSPLQ